VVGSVAVSGGDSRATEESNMLMPLFAALILLGCFVWVSVTFALLEADSTLMVHGLCGRLWEYMLIRTIAFTLELLQALLLYMDAENWMRQCLGMNQLEEEETGGCFALLFGGGETTAWWAAFVHFLYNLGFAFAGAIIVPAAVVDAAPCCVNALAASSFTGTYTLASFAWVHLALDCVQTTVRGTWLAHRRAEGGCGTRGDPYSLL
jgi:hypothetical protein